MVSEPWIIRQQWWLDPKRKLPKVATLPPPKHLNHNPPTPLNLVVSTIKSTMESKIFHCCWSIINWMATITSSGLNPWDLQLMAEESLAIWPKEIHQPAPGDLNLKSQRSESSLVMVWLINSMESAIGKLYLFLPTEIYGKRARTCIQMSKIHPKISI